ncbi:MAG: response regulator [Halobacteriovoraceae bacterium]|nr:response regulator [Halobacteriovoraceae bacterium]
MNDLQRRKLLREFLANNDVLLVDTNGSSLKRLTKTLIDLGGIVTRIHQANNINDAKEIFKNKIPQLVLSDYSLRGGSGFDFFRFIREEYPDEKKLTLILVTANTSQSAVARAAEEDVDSFVIKPYTLETLESSIMFSVVNKLNPSRYSLLIEEGKELLFNQDFDGSIKIFEEAIKINPEPSLALYYHGQAKYFLEELDAAETDYNKGLQFNKIHYKCQIGLYELYKKLHKSKEAYQVVRTIAKYFPANPDRLNEVIRLCVEVQDFENMQDYYDIFTQLDERPSDVLRYVCAGMYVSGKHFAQEQRIDRMKEIFNSVGVTCQGDAKFLRAIIQVLYEKGQLAEAKKYLSKFDKDEINSHDYMVASYLAELDQLDQNQRIKYGLEIYNSDAKDLQCFNILLNSMKNENLIDRAKNLVEDAKKHWPNAKFNLEDVDDESET